MKYLFVFIIFTLIFSGCSSRKKVSYKKKLHTKNIEIPKDTDYKTKALYNEYKKWIGTKYKYGGEDLKGVDCSSFVQQVYLNAFGLHIPRTTKEQVKIGYKISKKELHSGDMIFFKTGWDVRHVAIAVDNGYFIHVSTKRGVSKSSIYNPYWKSNYWQSRRVLP